jgi:rhodanese-related sulfurtransferase
MWTYLNENGLRQVDAEEAQQLVRSQGATIVDVRLASDYAVSSVRVLHE